MRRGSGDRLAGLGRVGEVDAAEFEQISRGRNLRRRMIDARNPRAPRQRFVHDHPTERTQRARHDNDFSVHEGPPPAGERERTYQEFFTGNAANFCMERSVSRAQIAAGRVCACT